jgi:Fe-S-cluster containining protein
MNKTPPYCDNCGACCQHMGYPPFVGIFYDIDEEFTAIPEELKEPIRQAVHELRGDRGLPCIWLEQATKKCLHYEYRPSICQDFEPGCDECHDHRKLRGIE